MPLRGRRLTWAEKKISQSGDLFPENVPFEASTDEDTKREGKYFIDPHDGLPVECVKPHSQRKHDLIRYYVDTCRDVRKDWPRATYIDLYCGPGRVRVDGQVTSSDASALAAWNASTHPSRGVARPLTDVVIADENATYVDAAEMRLKNLGAPVSRLVGPAEKTVVEVARTLPSNALHFALLDPYALRPLPFSVIETLAPIPHLDVLIHVAVSDIQRNLGFFLQGKNRHLDGFSPRWRERYVKSDSNDTNVRRIVAGWCSDIAQLGKPLHAMERIAIGDRPLYWLVLVSAHPLAIVLWDKVKKLGKQRELTLPG